MNKQQIAKQHILESLMRTAPVVPVVIVDDVRRAVAMAKALVRGGLPVIEVTLRTARALDCLEAIAAEVPDAMPGAGTVLEKSQIKAVEEAGARFMVSPGAAPKLLDAAEDSEVPLLPGTATPGEMMTLGERGYRHLKFFPASVAGGSPFLKALASPLPMFRYCPTGGISAANAREYLALPNVLCVGGSWVAPQVAIDNGDVDEIERLARDAASLPR